MGTSQDTIKEWAERGIKEKATHMIVVCDTFDWDDYPVYVKDTEDVRKKKEEYDRKSMQKVMEVYNLRMDLNKQLSKTRVFNY